MTLEEFGQNVSVSGLLTAEEIILFYEKFSGLERTSEIWNMTKREAKEEILLRCCRYDDYLFEFWLSDSAVSGNLCMSFSKPVKFHGVRLLGDKGEE